MILDFSASTSIGIPLYSSTPLSPSMNDILDTLMDEFKKEAIEADDNQQVYSGYQKFIKLY